MNGSYNSNFGVWERFYNVSQYKSIPFNDVLDLQVTDYLNTLSWLKERADWLKALHDEQMKKIKSRK